MKGDRWTARLSEHLDGDLPADERNALEDHLEECDECRETLAQLRRVRMRAGSLEDRPPQADLWPSIAERIGVNTGAWTPARREAARRWTFSLPQLATAAALLLVVGAGSMWFAVPRGDEAAAPGMPALVPATVPATTFAAQVPYTAAIADLEALLAARRDQLDTATVRVLVESLEVIDRAIGRARAALDTDPSDIYLNTHLAETMRRKLDLLRRAAGITSVSL